MYPNLTHHPFERIENQMVIDQPEEPTIQGSGYYERFSDEFIPDDEAFDYAMENWDCSMMNYEQMEEFKKMVVKTVFQNWERIEAE